MSTAQIDVITRYTTPTETLAPVKLANALARGVAMRKALNDAKPGDFIWAPPSWYHFGKDFNLPVPPGVTIHGAGARTRFTSGFVNDIGPGCQFELGDQSVLEDLFLESDGAPWDQDVLVGFGAKVPETTPGASAIVRRCQVKAGGFCFYNWRALHDKLFVFDCWGQAGRWGCYAGRSSGTDACEIHLRRVWLNMDASTCLHQGAQEANLIAIGSAAGLVTATGCEFSLTASGPQKYLNPDGTPHLSAGQPIPDWLGTSAVNATWIDPDGGIAGAMIELRDCHIRTTAPAGIPVLDLVPTIGTINHFGGSGNGLGGAFIK